MNKKLEITLVTTCFNEILNVEHWIKDIENQTKQVDEICIVDAGSTDGTFEILKNWANRSAYIKVEMVKKCNVAQGRNAAIKMANSDIIISTDMGCRIDHKWVEEIIIKFVDDPAINVVAGNFAADIKTIHTKVAKLIYSLKNGYKPKLDSVFLPSSRSIAYRKNVWEQIGGYAEWLSFAGDDTLFATKIHSLGFNMICAPDSIVYWGRHEQLSDYVKEEERYGLGNGEFSFQMKNFLNESLPQLLKYPMMIVTIFILTLSISTYDTSFLFLGLSTGLLSTYYWLVKIRRCFRSIHHNNLFKIKYSDIFVLVLLSDILTFGYVKGYLKGYLKPLYKIVNKKIKR